MGRAIALDKEGGDARPSFETYATRARTAARMKKQQQVCTQPTMLLRALLTRRSRQEMVQVGSCSAVIASHTQQ